MAPEKEKTQSDKSQKYASRTLMAVWPSLATTLAFGVFNIYLYIAHHALWNVCIAVYYFLLFAIRLTVAVFETKVKNDENSAQKYNKLSVAVSVLFLAADVALVAPIALMAMQKRDVSYSTITAISSAAYTCYKIVGASINLKKSSKIDNLSVQILRALNFKDAIMSVIVLQYVLIKTFGGGATMDTMCDITNFVLWAVIVAVSVVETVKSIKRIKIKN